MNETEYCSSNMTDEHFRRISLIIEKNYGIKMPPEKKVLLECRLSKRLRALNIKSFDEYFAYLFDHGGLNEEIVDLINVVSTNKTEFFREDRHFDYLMKDALPEILAQTNRYNHKTLFAWSAACSTGEEPYTLAMVMNEFKEKNKNNYPLFDFRILATDISTHTLDKAQRAVYGENDIESIPENYKEKYLLRNRDPEIQSYRIIPELRSKVIFHRLNLMDSDYGIENRFDLIFCRNVLIYFNNETQVEVIKKFKRYLVQGGFLFIGHSETLINMDVPFVQKAPTVYRSKDD